MSKKDLEMFEDILEELIVKTQDMRDEFDIIVGLYIVPNFNGKTKIDSDTLFKKKELRDKILKKYAEIYHEFGIKTDYDYLLKEEK